MEKMNIYNYLNSPDIAAHCEKIGHVFNPLEMAVIIALSKKTMKEKHTAWRAVIADYPDMPIKWKGFQVRDSLHEYLWELIAFEERFLSEFFEHSHECVFRPYIVRDNDRLNTGIGCYYTAEKAWKAIRKSSKNWLADKITHVKIYKERIAGIESKSDEVWVNSDGEVFMYTVWENDHAHGHGRRHGQPIEWLEEIFIHIPVPFQKGDLVELVDDSNFVGDGPRPRVLQDLLHWQPDYEKQLSGELVCGYFERIAWTYFMDEEGRLRVNHLSGYFYDLKYYTDECKGYDRFLPYLSYFIKEDKVDVGVLIRAYDKVKSLTEYEKHTSIFDTGFHQLAKFIEEAKGNANNENTHRVG